MKKLRRFIWYIAGRLTLVTAILGLMTIAFYFAMNVSNIYVILKDGMAQRAVSVMNNEANEDLSKYFSSAYLPLDKRLAVIKDGSNPYEPYSITGIDHRLRMEWMWTWPWEDTARATITEEIPAIDGRVKASYRTVLPQEKHSPPKWPSARYDVILIRENGRWLIRELRNERAYLPE